MIDEIFSVENLYKAHLKARKSKAKSPAAHKFDLYAGYECAKLSDELLSGVYAPQPYKEFVIYEPKRRDIKAPAYRDCVVQHALYAAIYPIIEPKLISQSHGCRVGKGFHSASDYVLRAMRASSKESYFLQCDVRKYYPSISGEILRKKLLKLLKNPELVNACSYFIQPRGQPVGNVLSQLFGLVFLNDLDHFIKRKLKIKYYCRFVDDFALFNLEKEHIKELLEQIKTHLANDELTLSKTIINKSTFCINFTGYLIQARGKRLRARSLKRLKAALAKEDLPLLAAMRGLAKNSLFKENL